MMYSKSDIDAIRKKIDICEFLESRGVALKPSGSSFVGLCPIHGENTPSFHVKPDAQTFKCFGCGAGGDIFTLVQDMDNYSFPGAVQFLAQQANVELSGEDDPSYLHRQRLLTITRLTAEWFRHHFKLLDMDHPAKQNLADRKLLDYSVMDESVGFAPNGGLLPLLVQKGFTDDEFIEAGIAKRYDDGRVGERFRNRLTWTIYNIQGQPIGFSARHIFESDKGPKYLNSPSSELYNKSKALLGLSDAKREISKTQVAYIVEGQTDVMAFKAVGKINTVASCGTAFGAEHTQMLRHLSKLGRAASHFKMVFCFDGDTAGHKAALNVFYNNPSIYLQAFAVKFVSLNGEAIDPCDYRKFYGDDKLRDFIDANQVSLVEFVLKETLSDYDIESPEGKSNYISRAKEILSQVSDSIQYSTYMRLVAKWTGVSYSELSNRSPVISARPIQHNNNNVEGENNSQYQIFVPHGDTLELNVIAAFVQYPDESFEVLKKLKMNPTIFRTRYELFQEVLTAGEDKTFNYGDQTINFLTHTNLMIGEDVEAGLTFLFNSYCNALYLKDSAQLDVRLEQSLGTPDEFNVFMEVIAEQEKLKVFYNRI